MAEQQKKDKRGQAAKTANNESKQRNKVEPKEEEEVEKEKNSEGKQIGGFIIGKTKGKGTFGKVKQGTHIVTGDKVAIKILEKDKIKAIYRNDRWIIPDYEPITGDLSEITRQNLQESLTAELKR